MEKEKYGTHILVFLLGLSALGIVLFLPDNAFNNILAIVLAVTAMKTKISYAKKGYKNILATIGSYAGAVANVFAIIELISLI